MADAAPPPFWLVWREDSPPPTFKHGTCDSAEAEARRLALAHPGQRFFVLPAFSVFETLKVGVTRFDLDVIPF